MAVEKNRNLKRRVCWVFLGNLIMAFGVGFLRLSGFGTDPFSCMNLGVSSHLPVGYGTYQMLFSIVLFVVVFLLDRKSFGIGAVVNMLLLGYMVEFSMLVFGLAGISIEGLEGYIFPRIVCLILGVFISCLGAAVYMECDLGASPYDRLAVVIEDRTHGKVAFRWARIGYDMIAILIGYYTGAVVGIATLVVGFCTGPLVSYMRKHIAGRMIQGKTAKQKDEVPAWE